MGCHLETMELAGTAGIDLHEVTGLTQAVVARSGIRDGLATVHVAGSTGAVTTIEYESGALADLLDCLESLAPMDGFYKHNERWHDGNGYSHLRAALMGPSLSVPVTHGSLALGTWQQILVLDFDNKPRQRKVLIQVLGEAS
jgi:secondary thiamine-phosphate synthase enzyme